MKHNGAKWKTNCHEGLNGTQTRTLEQNPSRWNRFRWIKSEIDQYYLMMDVTVRTRILTLVELSWEGMKLVVGESLFIKLTALKGLLYPYEVRILCP